MADFLAVDLGATSGRVAIGRVRDGRIDLEIAHRFQHEVITSDNGSIFWNWNFIVQEVLRGLKVALQICQPISLAIDSWAVDYGLIGEFGDVLSPIYAYRDPRTELTFKEITARIGRERIYASTGIQFLPINTICSLFSKSWGLLLCNTTCFAIPLLSTKVNKNSSAFIFGSYICGCVLSNLPTTWYSVFGLLI